MSLVSIIVPIYNGKDFIRQTILQIENQTYREYEVLFVDDGSTDGTRNILKKFLAISAIEKWSVLESLHLGLAHARNLGIINAKGEFIAFLDCDDKWHPEKLQYQVEAMKDSEVDVVFSQTVGFDKLSEKTQPHNSTARCGDPSQILKSEYVIYGGGSNVLIRSRLVREIGLFDESLLFAEDLDYWIRAMTAGTFLEIPYKHVFINFRNDSMQRKNDIDIKIQILKSLIAIYNKWKDWNPLLIRRITMQLFSEQIHAALKKRNWDYAKQILSLIIDQSKELSADEVKTEYFFYFLLLYSQAKYSLTRLMRKVKI